MSGKNDNNAALWLIGLGLVDNSVQSRKQQALLEDAQLLAVKHHDELYTQHEAHNFAMWRQTPLGQRWTDAVVQALGFLDSLESLSEKWSQTWAQARHESGLQTWSEFAATNSAQRTVTELVGRLKGKRGLIRTVLEGFGLYLILVTFAFTAAGAIGSVSSGLATLIAGLGLVLSLIVFVLRFRANRRHNERQVQAREKLDAARLEAERDWAEIEQMWHSAVGFGPPRDPSYSCSGSEPELSWCHPHPEQVSETVGDLIETHYALVSDETVQGLLDSLTVSIRVDIPRSWPETAKNALAALQNAASEATTGYY